jgi:hypothetical protein
MESSHRISDHGVTCSQLLITADSETNDFRIWNEITGAAALA